MIRWKGAPVIVVGGPYLRFAGTLLDVRAFYHVRPADKGEPPAVLAGVHVGRPPWAALAADLAEDRPGEIDEAACALHGVPPGTDLLSFGKSIKEPA
jgi:hypothetical protein